MPTVLVALIPWFALSTACTGDGDDSSVGGDDSGTPAAPNPRILALSPLPPPPADPTNRVAEDPDAAWLGRFLYFDTRLSGTGTFSCATCHDPSKGFTDGLPFSEAAGTTARHAPTVLNSVYNAWFFWDGRADSHWAQALGPIENPAEQDSSRLAVAHLVADDPELSVAYAQVFGALPDLSDGARFPPTGRPLPLDPTHPDNLAWEGMTPADQDLVNQVFANVGKAIAAYERLLIRGNAPFDTYVEGLREDDPEKLAALSPEAVQGLDLYLGEGKCFFCHTGPNFSTGSFANIGLAWVPGLQPDDIGRFQGITALLADPFNGLGAYSDDPEAVEDKVGHLVQGAEQVGQFKIASLRNVAETAPYMHGGQFATLTDVVGYYSRLDQTPEWGHREDLMVPLEWDDQQIAAVVAFLESLTGEPLDPELTTAPASPIPPQ